MKSKKPSVASSNSGPLERPVLFLDRSLGRVIVADALRSRGARVEIHGYHFVHDAADEHWLASVARRGWIVLTKDARIRHRPNEVAAIRNSGTIMIVLNAVNLTGGEMAEIFTRALPRIERATSQGRGPAVFLLGRDARLNRVRI